MLRPIPYPLERHSVCFLFRCQNRVETMLLTHFCTVWLRSLLGLFVFLRSVDRHRFFWQRILRSNASPIGPSHFSYCRSHYADRRHAASILTHSVLALLILLIFPVLPMTGLSFCRVVQPPVRKNR